MTTNQSDGPDGWKAQLGNSSRLIVAALLIAGALEVVGDVQRLDVLTTSKAAYTNVIVTGKSSDNVFIRHKGGVANLKVTDLGDEARLALGYTIVGSENKSTTRGNTTVSRSVNRMLDTASVEKLQSLTGLRLPLNSPGIHLNPSLVIGLMTGALLGYLFSCYCFAMICRKVGQEPGVLIWIPVFQLIPLLRAAGMSGWWFVAFFLPILNLVAHILWSVNIVRARNKSVWWSILMILPVTNLFAILYLAFSSTTASDSEQRVQVATPQPA